MRYRPWCFAQSALTFQGDSRLQIVIKALVDMDFHTSGDFVEATKLANENELAALLPTEVFFVNTVIDCINNPLVCVAVSVCLHACYLSLGRCTNACEGLCKPPPPKLSSARRSHPSRLPGTRCEVPDLESLSNVWCKKTCAHRSAFGGQRARESTRSLGVAHAPITA